MRMLPISRHSRLTKSETSKDIAGGGDHRRSWHMGSAPKQRRSLHTFRKTWHFHRHSEHPNLDPDLSTKRGRCAEQQHVGEGDEPQKRKSFAYASHVIGEETNQPYADDPPQKHAGQHQHSSSSHTTRTQKEGWLKKAKHRTGRVLQAIEYAIFPGCRPLRGSSQEIKRAARTASGRVRPALSPGGIPLVRIEEVVQLAKTRYGEEGLRATGFEFRRVPCTEHQGVCQAPLTATKNGADVTEKTELVDQKCTIDNSEGQQPRHVLVDIVNKDEDLAKNDLTPEDQKPPEETASCAESMPSRLSTDLSGDGMENEVAVQTAAVDDAHPKHFCRLCSSRLFHISSNTRIDSENRRQFIADGEMYDAIAKLCQENAQEVMMQQHGLVWVTVCDAQDPRKPDKEPIRALVNAEHPLVQHLGSSDEKNASAASHDITQEQIEYYSQRPTLLVATGKGKVRAGVFSRQHLLVSGMESSTALPLITEARRRELNLVIVDPNARGDRFGMVTFEKSMATLFPFWEGETTVADNTDQLPVMKNLDLYVLSHSASGGHFMRYLLEKSQHYVPHIRAIAFTDSTHNVQWARKQGNDGLLNMLESDTSIYFRSATANTDENWSLHHAGQDAHRDQLWKHRFGNIRTCWAGTKEHSLTNWFALSFIWQHFDKFLNPEEPDHQCQKLGAANNRNSAIEVGIGPQ